MLQIMLVGHVYVYRALIVQELKVVNFLLVRFFFAECKNLGSWSSILAETKCVKGMRT